jgi:hypothetical protein
VGYNQIFMAKEDVNKTALHCPRFISLFEWVVMTFRLKNAGATYQRAMNLKLSLGRMKKYGLRMNLLKCAFGVTSGRFLGFIVHEHDIQIDPKKIESIGKIGEPVYKKDV